MLSKFKKSPLRQSENEEQKKFVKKKRSRNLP